MDLCDNCCGEIKYFYNLTDNSVIKSSWCVLCLLFSDSDSFDKKIVENIFTGRCIMCCKVGSSEQNIIGNIGGVFEVRFNLCSQDCFYNSLKHYSKRIIIH